jgi:hypothetical protein
MNILAQFGSTDGLTFDHYETDFDFSWWSLRWRILMRRAKFTFRSFFYSLL